MAVRGLRNNNPLNLSYLQGQPGVTGSDGRFGTYANLTDGGDLDEELCQIDDALEQAGFEPGNSVRAIRMLAAQAKRRALVTCPKCLRTTKRAKPKRKGKKR